MYSEYYTKANPGLWVLLTDESEESCQEINKFINEAIMIDFNGRTTANRCYFHILGYNGSLKVLQTGYLQTFEENPREILEHTKQVPDGEGGYLEVLCKTPIWVKPQAKSKDSFVEAIRGAGIFIKEYIQANPQSPAPIVWHFANDDKKEKEYKLSKIDVEIARLKQITSRDGGVLFVHVNVDSCAPSHLANVTSLSKYCSNLPLCVSLIYKYLWEFERYLPNYNHRDAINKKMPLCITSRFISRWERVFMGYLSEPRLDTDIWDFCKELVSRAPHK